MVDQAVRRTKHLRRAARVVNLVLGGKLGLHLRRHRRLRINILDGDFVIVEYFGGVVPATVALVFLQLIGTVALIARGQF